VAGGVVYEVEPTMGLAADAHELPALVAVTIFLAVGGLSQHSHDGVAAAAADPRLRLVHRGMSFLLLAGVSGEQLGHFDQVVRVRARESWMRRREPCRQVLRNAP